MVRDAEPRCERRAITVVPVDQLQNSGGSTGCANAVLQLLGVERVDEPDAGLRDERVRAAL